MSTAKMVLVVLFLLVALGIVGRMDYEDAQRMERANIQDGIRLLCVRFPIDASGERGPSKSKRGHCASGRCRPDHQCCGVRTGGFPLCDRR